MGAKRDMDRHLVRIQHVMHDLECAWSAVDHASKRQIEELEDHIREARSLLGEMRGVREDR